MARRLFVVLAAVGLLAAACGDDGGGGGDSTTTDAPELTGEPVKLMVIYDGSGATAFPDQADGAIAAAGRINREGGIDGGPVEILACDTEADANIAAECGRQAVAEDVLAVVGSISLHSDEYFPLLAENQIPSIGNNPASAGDLTSEASFPITGGAVSTFGTLPVALAEEGRERISLARIDLSVAAGLASFANVGLERLGLEIVDDVAVPAGAPDMASYVDAALQGDVDGIVIGMAGQDATNFAIAAKQADPDVQLAFVATDEAAALEALGDQAEGLVVATPFRDDEELLAEVEADYEAAGLDGALPTLSYASVLAVAEMAKDLPQITHEALWAHLPTVENLNIGIMPLLQFVEGGAGGVPRIFNPCEAGLRLLVSGDETDYETILDYQNPFTGDECEFGPARLP
jgi:ABC-type branched-subunit amino acid transport system substrate-binding protein